MNISKLLEVPTLVAALEHFLKHTDAIVGVEKVSSFRINGHELIETFMDYPVRGDGEMEDPTPPDLGEM